MHYLEGVIVGLFIPILFPDFYDYINKKIRKVFNNAGVKTE